MGKENLITGFTEKKETAYPESLFFFGKNLNEVLFILQELVSMPLQAGPDRKWA